MRYFAVSISIHVSLIFLGLLLPGGEKFLFPERNRPLVVEIISQSTSPRPPKTVSVAKKRSSQILPKTSKVKKISEIVEEAGHEESIQSPEHKKRILSYAQELKAFLERNKYYPRQAIRLKQAGIVQIEVKIDANGTFKEVQISKPSSFPILDQAAINLIKKLGRFKPLPETIRTNSNFVIPIAYVIGGG